MLSKNITHYGQFTKLFWTAGPRPVEIATVQSIPVAVGKALAIQY